MIATLDKLILVPLPVREQPVSSVVTTFLPEADS
jgi:hypothetical protein